MFCNSVNLIICMGIATCPMALYCKEMWNHQEFVTAGCSHQNYNEATMLLKWSTNLLFSTKHLSNLKSINKAVKTKTIFSERISSIILSLKITEKKIVEMSFTLGYLDSNNSDCTGCGRNSKNGISNSQDIRFRDQRWQEWWIIRNLVKKKCFIFNTFYRIQIVVIYRNITIGTQIHFLIYRNHIWFVVWKQNTR